MQTGLDQYAIKKFAEALEIVPRILSETAGQDAEKVNIVHQLKQYGSGSGGVQVFCGRERACVIFSFFVGPSDGLFARLDCRWVTLVRGRDSKQHRICYSRVFKPGNP